MSYMMQHFMQRGLNSFLGSGGNDQGSMNTALSQLQNRTTSDPDNPLIPQVKSNAGLQDDNQTKLYTSGPWHNAGACEQQSSGIAFYIRQRC